MEADRHRAQVEQARSPAYTHADHLAARALLAAVASGSSVPGYVPYRLVEAVLQQPAVLLALRALDGGPHTLDRAIELARLVDAAAAQSANASKQAEAPSRGHHHSGQLLGDLRETRARFFQHVARRYDRYQ